MVNPIRKSHAGQALWALNGFVSWCLAKNEENVVVSKLNLRSLKALGAGAAVCLAAWSCSTVIATAQAANAYVDTEQQLRLRLRNDFRRAQKPSSGEEYGSVYAWVQSFLLEYDSGWLNDVVGVEAGGFWTQRIDEDPNFYTRLYLHDRDSFGYATAALKFKLGEYGLIKAGRFITDHDYGALPYYVPVLTANSNRPLPSASQGVLLYLTPTDFMDIWAVWRNEIFIAASAMQGGFRNEGVFNPASMDYDEQKANNILAVSLYGDNWRWSTGGGYQEDVQTQVMTQLENSFNLGQGKKITTELRYGYVEAKGDTKELAMRSWPDGTANLFKGSIMYHSDWGSIGFSAAYLDHKTMGQVYDPDIGDPFNNTIPNNFEEMQIYQLTTAFKLPYDFRLMIAPIYSHGYEDKSKQVPIDGYDFNIAAVYMPKSGPLAGLLAYLSFNRAIENRPGSEYGDHLQYWDVKMGFRYDLNFLK